MGEDPVEGAVGRVEQPQPGERAHRRRDDPRDQQHAAPFALALLRDVVDEMGDDKADHRLEDDRGDREQHRLLDHHPERVALEQEREIPEADEMLHRLVQRRQMDRVERRIDHQAGDDRDQRQRHQERDRGPPAHEAAEARPAAGPAYAYVAGYGVGHLVDLLFQAPAAWPASLRRFERSYLDSEDASSTLSQACENASPPMWHCAEPPQLPCRVLPKDVAASVP